MKYYHYCKDQYEHDYEHRCSDRREHDCNCKDPYRYDYEHRCRDRRDYDCNYKYNHCCKPGPVGPAGVSTIIKGSYDTLCELMVAHPTGMLGDAYLVAGILHVWNPKLGPYGGWERIGSLMGPTAPCII